MQAKEEFKKMMEEAKFNPRYVVYTFSYKMSYFLPLVDIWILRPYLIIIFVNLHSYITSTL